MGRVAEGPGEDPLELEPGPLEQSGVVGQGLLAAVAERVQHHEAGLRLEQLPFVDEVIR